MLIMKNVLTGNRGKVRHLLKTTFAITVSRVSNILGLFHISITDGSFAKLLVHCRR